MSGNQLENVLDLIDSNIQFNMESVRSEVLGYLTTHVDELAHEIAERGYGDIPTSNGAVRISREDLQAAYA